MQNEPERRRQTLIEASEELSNAMRDLATEMSLAFLSWLRSPAWWAWLAVAIIAALLLDGITP
jgi:hypothetical protein